MTNTQHKTRSLLAVSAVAMAALFIVSTGIASADHELTDETIFSKTTDCPAQIEIGQAVSTACSFTITYANAGIPAIINDTVPAEWNVTNADAINAIGDCTVSSANKVPGNGPDKNNKKADRSATKIICSETDALTLTVEIATRESPSTVKHANKVDKFKPTSCDPEFAINDGAHAVDPVTGDLIASTLSLTTVALDPEDVDCDGLTADEETALGTNPDVADTDMDGLLDGEEVNTYGTDPLLADSDGDLVSDGDEVANGTDPNDPESF